MFLIFILLCALIYLNIGVKSDPYAGFEKLPGSITPTYDDSNDWWKATTVYQIYPRSFKDSDGDGIGDLKGILNKLDYIKNLGFETIWISPFFQSPQMDHGYDVSDYLSIEEDYGDIQMVDSLIAAVHNLDMKIVFDLVLNHTSIEHEWFKTSRSSKNNPKSDWYIWRDGDGKDPPNNWKTLLGQRSAWEYAPERDQWYYAAFLPFQPDLNMRNPEVKEKMFDIVRFWLEKGVDGFRLDIFNFILEDPDLKDNPRTLRYLPNVESREWVFEKHVNNFHHEDVIAYAKELREVVEEYPDRFLVGEVFGTHFDMRQLIGEKHHDGLNMVFLFDFLEHFEFSAKYFKQQITLYEDFYPAPLVPTYVFGNHDQYRSITRLDNDIEKAKMLALFQLTVRGVPFTYQGEEIGMTTANIPVEKGLDPLAAGYTNMPKWLLNKMPFLPNRDNCRTPMQWDTTLNAGFSKSDKTWLPAQNNYVEINVQDQMQDPNSLLHTYQSLLQLRKSYKVLQEGALQIKEGSGFPKEVLSFIRKLDTDELFICLNFSKKEQTIIDQSFVQYEVTWKSNFDAGIRNNQLDLPPFSGVILEKS